MSDYSKFMPGSSVELEVLTTETAWGSTKEVDIDIFEKDDEGKKSGEVNYWKILNFMTRDLRLGNLSHKFDDYEWLEDRLTLGANILSLRKGRFNESFVLAISPVVSTLELSQSRMGFFRKNKRSVSVNTSSTERTEKKKIIPLGAKGGF